MSFEDKVIVCEDCSQEFVHSAEDQERYAERGFTNDPKRCRPCREKRKQGGGGGGGGDRRQGDSGRGRGGGHRGYSGGGGGGGGRRSDRPSYEAVCAACGKSTTVPFQPTEGRPVYCRDCYRSLRR